MNKFNKFVYICIGVIFSAATLFMSCATPPVKSVTSPTNDIHVTNQDLVTVTNGLNGTTDKITQDATSGLSATPPGAMAVLQPKWQDILLQAGYQKGMIDNLKQAQVQLTSAEAKSKSLEDAFNTEHAARLKAQSDATKELRAKYTWISIACFAGLVLAIGAAVSGIGGGSLSKIAYGGAVCSGIGLAISIALIQTVALIPWIVGGACIICGGLVIYRFFHKNTTITAVTAAATTSSAKVADLSMQTTALSSLNQGLKEENHKLNTASTELVHTIEASKPFMTIKGRRTVFGDGPVPGVTHIIQSPTTRALVSSARNNLPNIAPSIPETITSDLIMPDMVLGKNQDDEEYRSEVYSQRPDTKSLRSRMVQRADVLAGKSTVVVLH